MFPFKKNPFKRCSLEEKINKGARTWSNWIYKSSCRQVTPDGVTARASPVCAKHTWRAGCKVSNALFRFPCLLFQSAGTEVLWTTTGVRGLKHLSEKCKRQKSSRSHLDNNMKLQFFGRVCIAEQLDQGYRVGIRRHNEEVTKNCHMLSRIIDCVEILCGL